MPTIKPTIDIADADEKYCNGCMKKIYDQYDSAICGVYAEDLTMLDDSYSRLDQCKKDEVKG